MVAPLLVREMIPRIIHFIWIGDEIPQWAIHNIDRFEQLNPDHEIRIHSGPYELHPSLVDVYEQCTNPAQQSDLIRYSVLLKHGGWYFDVDFLPFRPVADAERGFTIKNGQTFVSRQQGHKSGDRAPYANAPLACTADAEGIREIIDVASRARVTARTTLGPQLVKSVVEKHPKLFTIGDAGWFFPLSIDQAKQALPYIYGGSEHNICFTESGTAGQMPIAAHLWASATNPCDRYGKCKPVVLVQKQIVERGLDQFATGLESVGFHVERADSLSRGTSVKPDLIVCWNGRRDTSWSEYALKYGIPILYSEYGFFKRGDHYQVDPKGILQWSEYARTISEPASEYARSRLRTFVSDPVEVSARTSGDILIMGQVDGDTQLEGSPVPGHAPLLRHISNALPDSVTAKFRPHPMHTRALRHSYPNIEVVERGGYKTKQALDLPDALAKARFVIAINSNALVEATAAGVPCLAFGPSLGLMASVYKQATIKFLKDDIQDMLHGWVPDTGRAESYLAHLAANQYHADELADVTVVESLLWRHYPALMQNVRGQRG